MVELVTPNEKVRDLTAAPRHIPIHMEGSVAFEVILTLWTTFEPHQKNLSQYLGKEFHEKVREMTPADLTAQIVAHGGPHCAIFLGVAGMLETAPHPHDPERMFKWLGDMAPTRLRRWLLGYMSESGSASLIEQAANGDLDALRELMECEHEESADEDCKASAFVEYFASADDDIAKNIADTLSRFYEEVFVELGIDFASAIERAAAARRSVANRDDAKTVVEEVTQGLDYDIPLGVKRVVLVPSVVTKPLSVIDQHRDSLIVYYGMADEFIDSDPEAPPSWIVNTYKALSDERRLRILRRLSEQDATLDDLTEMLGLSKSTVHHHISVLRSAGLVRIHVQPSEGQKHRTYSLRDNALGDATGFLSSYLRSNDLEVEHA